MRPVNENATEKSNINMADQSDIRCQFMIIRMAPNSAPIPSPSTHLFIEHIASCQNPLVTSANQWTSGRGKARSRRTPHLPQHIGRATDDQAHRRHIYSQAKPQNVGSPTKPTWINPPTTLYIMVSFSGSFRTQEHSSEAESRSSNT